MWRAFNDRNGHRDEDQRGLQGFGVKREPEPDPRPEVSCPQCGRKPAPSWGKQMLTCSCGWTMTYTEYLEKIKEDKEDKEDKIADQDIEECC